MSLSATPSAQQKDSIRAHRVECRGLRDGGHPLRSMAEPICGVWDRIARVGACLAGPATPCPPCPCQLPSSQVAGGPARPPAQLRCRAPPSSSCKARQAPQAQPWP
eukprot:1073499-Pelagomonas_calceolata.AAC.3